jgi:hypothetical protein
VASSQRRFLLRGNTVKEKATEEPRIKHRLAADLVTHAEAELIDRINTTIGTWPTEGTIDNTNLACAVAVKLLREFNGVPAPRTFRLMVGAIMVHLCGETSTVDMATVEEVCKNGRLGRG